jgi:hypothetical protein
MGEIEMDLAVASWEGGTDEGFKFVMFFYYTV